jgi:Ku protein
MFASASPASRPPSRYSSWTNSRVPRPAKFRSIWSGNRFCRRPPERDPGEEVANEDIVKGYKVDTDTYVTVDKDELDNIALESTRTIDIDEFVPKSEIDELYLVRPYYIVPDGKVGHDAFAVNRETIRAMDKVTIARVELTNREHIIALEARGRGRSERSYGTRMRSGTRTSISTTSRT